METGNIVQKDFILSGNLSAETQTIGGQLSSDNGRIGGALSATEGLGGALSFLGKPGLSAYQIAVLYGYEGTEEEWIGSLNGLTPEIEVEEIPNGYIFTITIGEEVQTFTIFKGEKGVYIGSDEMPEGYCIQIDPDGDLDGILDAMVQAALLRETESFKQEIKDNLESFKNNIEDTYTPPEIIPNDELDATLNLIF